MKELLEVFINKIDAKTVIIIFLFVIAGVFAGLYIFGGSSTKSENDRLKQTNIELENQKKKTQGEFDKLVKIFKKDSTDLVKIREEFAELEKENNINKRELERSKKDLEDQRKRYEDSKAKIKEFSESTDRKTGSALIKSVKDKTE